MTWDVEAIQTHRHQKVPPLQVVISAHLKTITVVKLDHFPRIKVIIRDVWNHRWSVKNCSHHTCFTPDIFYTKAIFHQAHFAPEIFCTKHLLQDTFYTNDNLHPTGFTPDTIYTWEVWHQKPFTPNTSYTKRVLHQTCFTPGRKSKLKLKVETQTCGVCMYIIHTVYVDISVYIYI